ncbi:MAG: hypothetical protein GXO21_07260 [Aquificae bacterium]|nr:hypothetical protein [Aquificota bacterium]
MISFIRKVFVLMCGFLICCSLRDVWAFSKEQHKADYVQALSYVDIYINSDNPIAKKVQEIIDEIPEEIEQIAGKKFSGGRHRIWGHWGLGGKIPKKTIEEICGEYKPQSECYKRVREIWKRQVNSLIELVSKELRIPKREAKQVAKIIYDIHLLGDYYFSSKGLSSLGDLKKLEKTQQIKRIEAIVEDISNALEKLGKKEEARKLRKLFRELKKKKLSSIDIASQLYVYIMKEGIFLPLSNGIVSRLNLFRLAVLAHEKNPDTFLKLLKKFLECSGRKLDIKDVEYLEKLVKEGNISKIIEKLFEVGMISRKDAFIYYLAYNDEQKALKFLGKLLEKSVLEKKGMQGLAEEVKKLIEEGKYIEALEKLAEYKEISGVSTEDIAYFKLIKAGIKYYTLAKSALKFGSVGLTYGVLSNVSCLANSRDMSCVTNIAKDSAFLAATYYVTEAVLVRLKNGKIGIIAKAISKGGGAAPIAMFILDSGKLFYSFSKGYISEESLKRDLMKNSIAMIYGYVVLAFMPGSVPVIVAVTASEFLVAYVVDRIYPEIYDRSLVYMSIEEMKKFFGLENIEHLTAFNLFEYENAFKQHYFTNSFNQQRYRNSWNQSEYFSPFR